MIDIDRMDEQLAAALTGAGPTPSAAPAPAPASAPELLELGRLEEADAVMAAVSLPRDALTWATMQALLDGRRDAARTGVEDLRQLAQRTDDPVAWDGYWIQRFWFAFEWGTEEERFDLLDHCRERAYRFDEVPWWGNLTLLLAAMGKADEATRAFDAAVRLPEAQGLDPLTNLIEAGVLLGDAGRVTTAFHFFRAPEGRLVVVGPGVVCKGSVDRYRALGLVALGRGDEAGRCFRSAEAAHRSLGARPLLDRTLRQASGLLVAA